MKLKQVFLLFVAAYSLVAMGGPQDSNEQMVFLGSYNAGQPGVNIYKLYDKIEDVLCYLLMPTVAGRRQLENGVWIYEGNTIGSLSCMKAKALPVSSFQDKKNK